MERSLTAAAKMRRRFKAGRPAKIQNVVLKPLQAIHRLVTEADKARNLMVDEGLDPNDVYCALVYATPELPGFQDVGRYRWLPGPGSGHTFTFYSAIEELANTAAVLFLGILWFQIDREATGDDRHVVWITQFMGGPKAEQILLNARDHFRAG